jgi:hypothetical protein
MTITVACVRTGDKYSTDYVHRLRRMVSRHLDRQHRFVVLTDNPGALPDYDTVPVSSNLPGWWAKMQLFSTAWRERQRVLYIDLDMVICGDIAPLADIAADFAICGSFVRATGNTTWPCKYGSCVMVLAPGWGEFVWQRFMADHSYLMGHYARTGDQHAIEALAPDGAILQELMPAGFFVHYRALSDHKDRKPDGCAVVVFAGKSKPANCSVGWVKEYWA